MSDDRQQDQDERELDVTDEGVKDLDADLGTAEQTKGGATPHGTPVPWDS